jgi:hypothetical protein
VVTPESLPSASRSVVSVFTLTPLRRWLLNSADASCTLSPDTVTFTGTTCLSGKVSVQPVVSAVAVSTYFVGLVSFPAIGTEENCHFPATSASARVGAGAGAGAGVIAAAVSFAGSSFFAHAATSRMAELARTTRVIGCMGPQRKREESEGTAGQGTIGAASAVSSNVAVNA